MTDEQRAREALGSVVAFAYEHGYHEHGTPIVDAYAAAIEARVRRELDAKVREMWGFNVAGAGDHISRNAVLRLLGGAE